MRIVKKYRGRDIWKIDGMYKCGKHPWIRYGGDGSTIKFPVPFVKRKSSGHVSHVSMIHKAKKMIDDLLDSNIKPKGYKVIKREK